MIYPESYVWRIVDRIEHYGRRAVVGVHGKIMKPVVKSYYKDKAVFHHCLRGLKKDQVVHVLGTGTTGFHTGAIRITVEDFKLPNMADVWLALIGQSREMPFISIARVDNWLKLIHLEDAGDTIYGKTAGRDEKPTEIFNSVRTWRLNYPKLEN